jgi:hypothetical protein
MNLEATATFGHEQLLDEVVTAYLKDVRAGGTPEPEVWLARYPQLAADLAEFFADHAAVERLAEPLRLAAPAALPTDAVGDYELLEVIAHGGMGVVYRARQKSLNRVVALKMVLAGRWAAADDVERFRARGGVGGAARPSTHRPDLRSGRVASEPVEPGGAVFQHEADGRRQPRRQPAALRE